MFKALATRLKQGQRTISFPPQGTVLSDRYLGRPEIDPSKCVSGCQACEEVCPTKALSISRNGLQFDMGRCLFCGECRKACPAGVIDFSQDYRLSVRRREDCLISGGTFSLAAPLEDGLRRLLGRSLKLRQVSAGGCNACEADVNVLGTITYDMGRFGIEFVASPRHADGLLITGPVSQNMALALKKTYEAVPSPKIVIASGACAISGGPYVDLPEVQNGCSGIVPVDLYIPGCPPHPLTVLDGLLRLLHCLPS
jgi:Ni,Fe-hydrogenase III small subunit/Pyruvate/2-oxoacid:ferredoxin oxidoreductase delta subunit